MTPEQQAEIKRRAETDAHMMKIKEIDPDYARAAIKSYSDAMPWLDLINGVKEKMK